MDFASYLMKQDMLFDLAFLDPPLSQRNFGKSVAANGGSDE